MSDVDDDKQAWWNSMKDAEAAAFKQFKDDIAAAPQIPLGVEIHNQADEWRIAALEAEITRLTTELAGARAAALKEAADACNPRVYNDSMDKEAKAECKEAILALAKVPAGYVVVPVEPTEAMIKAGWIDKEDVNPEDIYRAMIAATKDPTP